MVASGVGDPEETEGALSCYAAEEVPEVRRALARAIRLQRDPRFADTLLAMAWAPVPAIRREVAEAMAVLPDERYLPALLDMLAFGELRPAARAALVAIGEPALAFLDRALRDPSVARKIRRHLPRTIHRFEPRAAARTLMAHLPDEADEAVSYKVLRALGRLRADHPDLELDRVVLERVTRREIHRAIQMLDWRIETDAARERDARLRTPGGELLGAILLEKERAALRVIFRLLGLLVDSEDFELLYEALRRGDRRAKASSRELLEHALPTTFRAAVLALVDDDEDRSRLARAAAALGFSPVRPKYEVRLLEMLGDPNEAVRSVAAYHIAELGLSDLADDLRTAQPDEAGFLHDVIARALEMLDAPTEDPHAA
jgi:HEAT repeat protein